MRLSTWLLPDTPAPGPSSPALLAPERSWDLAPAFPGEPNLEGLALLSPRPDGLLRLALVRDNDYGGVQGPSELFILPLDPSGAAQ